MTKRRDAMISIMFLNYSFVPDSRLDTLYASVKRARASFSMGLKNSCCDFLFHVRGLPIWAGFSRLVLLCWTWLGSLTCLWSISSHSACRLCAGAGGGGGLSWAIGMKGRMSYVCDIPHHPTDLLGLTHLGQKVSKCSSRASAFQVSDCITLATVQRRLRSQPKHGGKEDPSS